MKSWMALVAALSLAAGSVLAAAPPAQTNNSLWDLAKSRQDAQRFSTLFTAQDVRDYLSKDAGIDQAIDWCRQTGVTHVFIEEFRDGYRAERWAILHARERFLAAGFTASGCITTTRVGKPSTGWWQEISCYSDQPTQEKLQSAFEYAASLFDEIIIDDFYFTDCKCPVCDAARQARTVTIGANKYPVHGDSWDDYHLELMLRMAQDRILAPAKRVNPKVKIILKYPQWYDMFHERGYNVAAETAAFDRIWVGTETRDYANPQWGGTVQYEGFFIMRWLGGIGGDKCGGGWYDYLGTSPATYIEQARETILGGARESFLFHYGGLHGGEGPADVAALRANIPELLAVAAKIKDRPLLGIAAYKPPNSHAEEESRVFDFVGMMGLPLAPCWQFPTNAPAAFFSIHALGDPNFSSELAAYIKTGRPVLLTDGLAMRLGGAATLKAPNVRILQIKGNPASLLEWPQAALDELRRPYLAALKSELRAPNSVALCLFESGAWVVRNFNDTPAAIELNGRAMTVESRGWKYQLP